MSKMKYKSYKPKNLTYEQITTKKKKKPTRLTKQVQSDLDFIRNLSTNKEN